MALIRHCDRCDSDGGSAKPFTLMSDEKGKPVIKADLCKNCQKQAKAFFKGEYSDENWEEENQSSKSKKGKEDECTCPDINAPDFGCPLHGR